ncbi:MAG: type 1 glutamine amidotransferase [Streptosporangiaceae bacterium]|nr:type 1 glutamine amidotransferase [Streptosporangiaceae bacterium]
MATELNGLRVAFVTANEGVEQAELTVPWQAVKDAGGTPELLAPEEGWVQGFNHLDKGDTFEAHRSVREADPLDYDALVLPGGVANADQIRAVPAAVTFARRIFEMRKPAAVICHGPWLLVEADLVRARTLTSWPSLKTDIRNAGGNWVDAEVHVDSSGPNTLVTSRKPDDLPAFCEQLVKVFQQQSQPA